MLINFFILNLSRSLNTMSKKCYYLCKNVNIKIIKRKFSSKFTLTVLNWESSIKSGLILRFSSFHETAYKANNQLINDIIDVWHYFGICS
jgi:hypothetical protein